MIRSDSDRQAVVDAISAAFNDDNWAANSSWMTADSFTQLRRFAPDFVMPSGFYEEYFGSFIPDMRNTALIKEYNLVEKSGKQGSGFC